ncbi:hypothetical protein [Aquimarina sp. 2304DJ70-9]|uniref:hypothetical protein n=1 Tax=Aquimarina penaris TaxID=3231044 RepID=UPI0034636626
MDNKQLYQIFLTLADHIEGNQGYWEFALNDVKCICITDELHNRMRIMAPIKEQGSMSLQEYEKCMEANFHSALDVRYAVSSNVLMAVFMHPLRELSAFQVEDALQQIHSAVKTYGTTHSSSNLYFPTKEDRRNGMN